MLSLFSLKKSCLFNSMHFDTSLNILLLNEKPCTKWTLMGFFFTVNSTMPSKGRYDLTISYNIFHKSQRFFRKGLLESQSFRCYFFLLFFRIIVFSFSFYHANLNEFIQKKLKKALFSIWIFTFDSFLALVAFKTSTNFRKNLLRANF